MRWIVDVDNGDWALTDDGLEFLSAFLSVENKISNDQEHTHVLQVLGNRKTLNCSSNKRLSYLHVNY